jgi:hypothetical protein
LPGEATLGIGSGKANSRDRQIVSLGERLEQRHQAIDERTLANRIVRQI